MSASKPSSRPGGRSARVQAAVHAATSALIAEHGRAAVTVPVIAARAGVTPSTIYRRWGDLAELLADVAVARLRPDGDPDDTGSLAGDLHTWAEQYADEMSAPVGLAMMRDVVAASGTLGPDGRPLPSPCARFTGGQIAAILERAAARGEAVPEVAAVMDAVVAPIVYHALFGPAAVPRERVRELVDACLGTVAKRRRARAA
jgi:AcrR family transcriptional regulator